MNSYQKLKKENEQLKRELSTLANDPASLEAEKIRFLYRARKELADGVFFGRAAQDINKRTREVKTKFGKIKLLSHPEFYSK